MDYKEALSYWSEVRYSLLSTRLKEAADVAFEVLQQMAGELKTNADRIRAMSDEELAEFLRWDICTKIRGDNRLCNGWCDECVSEWLQQPAEEDAV